MGKENLKRGNPSTQYGSSGRDAVADAYKSHEARRLNKERRRTMREVFDAISDNDAPDRIKMQAEQLGLPVPLTLEEAYAIAMAKEIINGNVGAYRAVAEVRGERKQDIGLTIESEQSKLSELLEQRKKRRK